MDKLPSKLVRLTIINTLAYYATVLIAAVPTFMVQAPCVDVIKTFWSTKKVFIKLSLGGDFNSFQKSDNQNIS